MHSESHGLKCAYAACMAEVEAPKLPRTRRHRRRTGWGWEGGV